MSHSRLAPSSMGVTVNCPGSVAMLADCPEDDTNKDVSRREEGTACHELAASLLEWGGKALLGLVCSNGIKVTDEIAEAADLYADHVRSIVTPPHELFVEQRVSCATIHPDCYGTPDAWVVVGNTLHLFDLKYGFTYVDAFENWQMLCYVAGILASLPPATVENVVFTIVQPASFSAVGPIKTWRKNVADLVPYFDRLRAAAVAALQPNAPTCSGPHCKHCIKRLLAHNKVCPAALQGGMAVYEVAAAACLQDMSAEALGLQLQIVERAIEQLKYLQAGMSEQVFSLVRAGKVVPGWAVQHSSGNLEWNKTEAEVFALGELFGVKLSKQKPITPTQAIKAGIDKTTVSRYASRKSGMKLSPITDKSIRKIFS